MEIQDEMESQRLWMHVTSALRKRDYDTASAEKAKIENDMRQLATLRDTEDLEWQPKYFRHSHDDDWHFMGKPDQYTRLSHNFRFLSIHQLEKQLREIVFKNRSGEFN